MGACCGVEEISKMKEDEDMSQSCKGGFSGDTRTCRQSVEKQSTGWEVSREHVSAPPTPVALIKPSSEQEKIVFESADQEI